MAIKTIKTKDLIQDDRNLNKGTERGKELIKTSVGRYGAGRSILIDRNNRIIAGNKTQEAALERGIDDVIVVETDGKKLVAVKRTDIDLDTKEGREMALADNATVKVDLDWDTEQMDGIAQDFDIDVEEWGVNDLRQWDNLDYIEDEQQDPNLTKHAKIIITLSEEETYDNIKEIVTNALAGFKVQIA